MNNRNKISLKTTLFILPFLLLATQLSEVSAQVSKLSNGDRVRIFTSAIGGDPFIGTVSEISDYALLVSTGEKETKIPLNSIHRLEVSEGKRKNGLKGALIGGVASAAAAGFVAFSVLPEHENTHQSCTVILGERHCINITEKRLTKDDASGFAIFFGLVGTIVGWKISKNNEKWKRLPMDISFNTIPVKVSNKSLSPMLSLKFKIGNK